MSASSRRLGSLGASFVAGIVVLSTVPSPATAAYTSWDVVWDHTSHASTYAYAYKDKNCTSTGSRRVRLDNGHLWADEMKSIKSPVTYMSVWYNYTENFILTYNTCWNLRGNEKIISLYGYSPYRPA
jgi:hypothetical protein